MLVYLTISMAVLLGCCGLAIDTGRMELRTTQLQAAADDAALTAAAEIQRGSTTDIGTLAQNEVSAFLTQTNLPNATAAAQYTASTGPYINDYAAIQVTLTQQIPLYFMALVGRTSASLSTSAVALVPPCAFFRGASSNSPAYTVTMASISGLDNACPAYVYQNLTEDSGSSIGPGQLKLTGAATESNMPGYFGVPAIYNAPVLADPLAYLTAPSFSSCTYVNRNITTDSTISPGTYCGGLTITSATVMMNPGLYIVTGGVNVQNGATLNGAGVTIYLTKGGGSNFGTFNFQTSTWNVSAPTDTSTGAIPGIVLFADRAWAGGQCDFAFLASDYTGDGIIYLTNTGLLIQGTHLGSAGNYFGLDVASMNITHSDIHPTSNYSTLPAGNPFHIAVSLLQ